MLLHMAWKNIFAYKKRTYITIILTVCMTGLMIIASSFMEGSHETMITSGVEIYPGYIQITGKDYRNSPGLENLILNTNTLKAKLSQIPGIATYGVRFESFVLYSHKNKAVGGFFTGIEPEKEQFLSRLSSSLVKGEFLEPEDTNQIYMGVELAKRLDLTPGDTLSFIGTGADYSFTADNLVVKGLFKTGLFEFDSNGAFVTKKYFDEVMVAENSASHIVVLPEDLANSFSLANAIANKLGDEYEATDWTIRLSGLVAAMKVDSIFGYLTLAIVFLVIFFVVMIYTYLSIFTRVRTVGVLRAIGTSPQQIATTLLLESVVLAGFGVVIGALIGGAVSLYFNINPIDYSGYEEQFKQYGLAASAMPATFSPFLILRDMVIMFILSLTSTLYPIIKVTGYSPIEAMHHV